MERYEKKVKKDELNYAIRTLYNEFVIDRHQIGDYIPLHVDVNSVFIKIVDRNKADSIEEKKSCIEKFSNILEDLTMGNCKVIKIITEEKNNSRFETTIYITNKYEVI